MATGFGTTIKQVNKLKIKLGIDGLYRIYPTAHDWRFVNVGEFGSLTEAIEFARNFKHPESSQIEPGFLY